MLFREIIAVHCDSHANHKYEYVYCGQNVCKPKVHKTKSSARYHETNFSVVKIGYFYAKIKSGEISIKMTVLLSLSKITVTSGSIEIFNNHCNNSNQRHVLSHKSVHSTIMQLFIEENKKKYVVDVISTDISFSTIRTLFQ
jgi:hypothetical protein